MKNTVKYTVLSLLTLIFIGSFYFLWSKDKGEDFVDWFESVVPQDATLVAIGNINEETALQKVINQFLQDKISFSLHVDGPGVICSNFTPDGFKDDTYFIYIQKASNSKKFGEVCAIIKKYLNEDELEYAEEEFQKLKINAPKDEKRGFSWAIGDGLLVMASSSKDIKTIFNKHQNEKSIKDLQLYKDAKAKVADCDRGFVFLNVPELFKNLPGAESSKNLKKINYVVSGLKKESSTLWKSFTYIDCDPNTLKDLLNGNGNINFSSLKYHPYSNSCCLGFNAKTLFNIFKQAFSKVTEGEQKGSELKLSFNPIETYAEMISQYITGEVVLSIDGLGKYQGKNFFNKESKLEKFLTEASSSPWMISIGINKEGKDIIDTFLESSPDLKKMLNYLVTDDYLFLMGEKMSPHEYGEKILADKIENSWLKALKFSEPPQGVIIVCEDCRRNRADTAESLRQCEGEEAKFAADVFSKCSELLRDSSFLVTVEENGVRINLSVETASLLGLPL